MERKDKAPPSELLLSDSDPGPAVTLASPDDVALQRTVLMALGGRLPLDHDGLIGAAAGDDCLWGGAGRLLREGQPVSSRAEREG